MASGRKLALLTAAVLVPLLLIAASMSLALAQEGGLDVRVIKSAQSYSVTAGESLLYTIAVSNGSSVTATNIVVTDILPPGVEYASDTDSCVDVGGVLSCTIPIELPPGHLSPFMLEVNVAPDAYNPTDPQICNNVWVTATTELGEGDIDLSDNHAEECTPLNEEADLAIDKWSESGPVVPVGEWFTYGLSVENLGPSNSRVPIVMDWFATDGSLSMVAGEEGICGPMPTDQGWAETPAWLMTWVNSICAVMDVPFCGDPYMWVETWWAYWYYNFPPMYPYPLAVDWMCAWPMWDMAPGQQTLTVSVLPLDPQTIYNQAWALPDIYPLEGIDDFDGFEYYGTPDPDLSNNMREIVTQVTNDADLSVVKFSKPDVQVEAGQPFTYTIYVENLGPALAHKVSIRDEMLSSGNFEIIDVILDPNRDNEGPIFLEGPQGGATIEFHLHEPLEPKGPEGQGRWIIQIVARAAETQDVNNLVQVFTREGGSNDPDLSNNQAEDSIAVGDVANLGINKGWDVAPPEWFEGAPFAPEDCYPSEGVVRAGCPLRFMLEVWNEGPSLAENVFVEDTLPAGVTVEGVGPSQGSCTTGIPGDPEAPLTCNLGNIPAGEGAKIEVFVRTDADLAWEPLENDALVSSDIFDPDNGNNRSHVLIWVEPFSYLYLDKDGPPEIMAGEEIHYWINLRNEGPSTAHDVYLDDELPGGISLLGAEVMIGEGSCEPDSALCSLGDMEPWENRAVRVRGYVEPWLEPGSLITNTVRAWANSPFFQPVPEQPISDTVETLVHSAADLSIRKTADPYKVYAGEQVQYDISVTNNGPAVARNVLVTDTLPSEVEFEISTADCGQGAGPAILLGGSNWNTAFPPPGELFSLDHLTGASGLIGPMSGGPLATEIEYDPNTGSLYASEVSMGNPYLHSLDPASGATVGTVAVGPYSGDPVVAGMEFVGPTLYATVHDWWWSTNAALYVLDPGTGFLSPVGPPTSYLQITGLAYDEATGTMYGVHPGSGSPATLLTLNLATGAATPVGAIMVGATQLEKVGSIEFGPDGNLYGGLTGNAPSYPKSLVRIDTSTAAATLVGDTGRSITGLTLAAVPSGDLVCHLGDIPPGETATFSIWARVKPDTLGMINNRVEVIGDTYDPNPDNNWDAEANLVLGKADLKVTKYGKPDGEVRAGDELEYWVVVDNLGPGFAHDVVLYDLISSDGNFELRWYGDSEEYSCEVDTCICEFDQCWCDYGEAQLTCRLNHPLPVMSPDSSGRWLFKVFVRATEDQSINNLAHVVSSDFDPDPSNNQAIAEHEITAVADLELDKEAWGEVLVGCEGETELWENEVAAGGMLEYRLNIYNEGPSMAENVVVEDWGLSPVLDIVDVDCEKDDGGLCSCNLSGLGELGDTNRNMVCYLGTILVGEEDEIIITARIPSDVPEGTKLVNDARVYSDVFDDYNGNDMDSNWTYVARWADLEVEKTQEPEIALPGQDITYSIKVTNLGLSDVEGVFISDTIPVQVLNPTWTCCASDGECDVPCEPPVCPPGGCPWPDIDLFAQADIPAGEWVIYTVEGTLDWWPCGPFTNTVEIIPPQSLLHPETDVDPCDENNVAEAVNDPFCTFEPLVMKVFPGPDSPP